MPITRFVKYRFPLRDNNQFDFLVDGDLFFKKMLRAISLAQHYILLEQYLVKSGHITGLFIQQLSAAAQRGIAVYLILDDYGAKDLNQADRQQLDNAGIQSCYFNPVRFKHFFHSLFRNHRKSLIIDGRLVFTGGAGLADEFSQEISGPKAWHEVILEIQGGVAQDWTQLFVQTWQKHARHPINLPILADSPSSNNTQSGQLLTSSPFLRQEINQALITQLRRAQYRVWITSPYFIAPRKIRRLLRQTARQGVDVRLLLPGPFSDHPWISYAARRYYTRMLKNGIRIFEYQPCFIHAKIQLCDDWVSIGSCNLDRWNQHWNLDANQSIENAHVADMAATLFNQDFSLSKEITWQEWQKRPWLTQCRERLSGQLILWLERLTRLRR